MSAKFVTWSVRNHPALRGSSQGIERIDWLCESLDSTLAHNLRRELFQSVSFTSPRSYTSIQNGQAAKSLQADWQPITEPTAILPDSLTPTLLGRIFARDITCTNPGNTDKLHRQMLDRCAALIGECPLVATAWPFIELNDSGVPFVRGTSTKLSEIVECHLAYRWTAEQLHLQLTGLSLPQIHAALGYYYDHKEECDALLQRVSEQSEILRDKHEDSALLSRLRSRLAK